VPHVNNKRLRALAITLPQRSAALPEIPAIAENLPGYAAFQWYGVLTPAGTPQDIINRLYEELGRVMQSQDLKSRIAGEGSISLSSTPQEFATHMREEAVKWAKVVEVSGAKTN